jgi:hypothetical protein
MRRQFNDVSSKSPLRSELTFDKTARQEDLLSSKGFQSSAYLGNPKFTTMELREPSDRNLTQRSQYNGGNLERARDERDQDDDRHQYWQKSEAAFSPKSTGRHQYDSLVKSQSTRHLQGDDLT